MKKYDVIIIGGGPAALSACRVFGSSKHNLTIGLIRPEDHSLIYCAMPYAVEGIIEAQKTFKSDKMVTDNNVDLIRGTAENVDFNAKEVKLKDGSKYQFEKLIIATGARPFVPNIPGINLKNVTTFKTEEELLNVKECTKNIKKAAVIGAGAIGIELAQALNSLGIETYLIDMLNHVLPQLVDKDMIEEGQRLVEENGIKLYLNDRVTELKGQDYAEEIVLASGKTIDFKDVGAQNALIVFSVGMRANIEMFKNTSLALGRNGIIVNAAMETNIKDVYAIGDCAEFYSGITGRTMEGKLATNAVPMGKVAAKRILGKSPRYYGFYNGAATKIYDLRIGGTGFTEKTAIDNGFNVVSGYGESTTKFPIIPGAKNVKVKLVVDKDTRKVVGGQVVGHECVAERVDLITYAIQKDSTIDEIAMFSYSSQPYQTYYPANNAIIMAAEDAIKKLS